MWYLRSWPTYLWQDVSSAVGRTIQRALSTPTHCTSVQLTRARLFTNVTKAIALDYSRYVQEETEDAFCPFCPMRFVPCVLPHAFCPFRYRWLVFVSFIAGFVCLITNCRFCLQVATQEWMSSPQRHVVSVYRGTFVVVFVLGGGVSLYLAKGAIKSLFTSNVNFDGEDQVGVCVAKIAWVYVLRK
jgi:hypothetical protein